MREIALQYLACPKCNKELNLQILESCKDSIISGLLICCCGEWYPIINYIPRMLIGELRGDYSDFYLQYRKLFISLNITIAVDKIIDKKKQQVKESFGNKWNSQPTWGIEGNSKKFMRDWIIKKYGWNNEDNYNNEIKRKNTILDAGCGLGREIINFAEANRNAQVFGLEISDCVDNTYTNVKHYNNIQVIQGDILYPPFRKGIFDLIFSEGVLHHTPSTEKAFKSLTKLLSQKGEIAIYVYKRKAPIREFSDDFLRDYTTKLKADECWEISRGITELGKQLAKLKVNVEVTRDIPILGIKAGNYDIQRFIYWHILKCFWNEKMNFDENNLVNFDWYHPAYAWRHTNEEVEKWYQDDNLKILLFNEEEAGFTVRGIK